MAQEAYKDLDEPREKVIILDLLLTAVNENRQELFWISLPTCSEQLLATTQEELTSAHEWNSVYLSSIIKTFE